ncbi:hypothetical protein O1W68_16630 [Rhodococcus sp. H36-A4]|uniref:phage scaffolding protein n=1 Tax=Rhodococcus sp. H36-A4 TaxID=3004353 RepID=UPI0022B0182D|nr:hypothetical protein [Rhodococcus sp. H36-A4]MCZ4079576.1 hypothetical protein [Rhodococcus sp. H36-A4]
MSDEDKVIQNDDSADVDALRAALKAANAEAATNRHKASELEGKLTEAQANSDRFKSSYVSGKAASELSKLGVANANVSKFLDMEKISVSESGELVGLDEQITDLQSTLPELFDPKRRAAKIDAADKPTAKKQLSSAEKLIQQAR